jgi:hypothetical protein
MSEPSSFPVEIVFGDKRSTIIISEAMRGQLELFSRIHQVDEATCVRMILQRYFTLTYKQRDKLENKIFWIQHRNKGFRSLPQFLKPKKPNTKKTKQKTVGEA